MLCSKLKWTEDLEEQIENETDHTGDSSINDHKNKVDGLHNIGLHLSHFSQGSDHKCA